ncbi:hypothetical protein [Novosphingobium terrae]|uniref:hypothetical protein n=1 Tax=Novosphingobium terrae TaxID=2726189 RepID=UPI0019826751|nr:hypothetical protein [Novosphingobium terrae]
MDVEHLCANEKDEAGASCRASVVLTSDALGVALDLFEDLLDRIIGDPVQEIACEVIVSATADRWSDLPISTDNQVLELINTLFEHMSGQRFAMESSETE